MSEEEVKSEEISSGSDAEEMEIEEEEVIEEEEPKTRGKSKKNKSTKKATKVKKSARKGTPKRKYKIKQGTRALREIKKYQKGGEMLIPKATVKRMFKTTLGELVEAGELPNEAWRVSKDALEAIGFAMQDYATDLFKIGNYVTVVNGRQTYQPKDMKVAIKISRQSGGNL